MFVIFLWAYRIMKSSSQKRILCVYRFQFRSNWNQTNNQIGQIACAREHTPTVREIRFYKCAFNVEHFQTIKSNKKSNTKRNESKKMLIETQIQLAVRRLMPMFNVQPQSKTIACLISSPRFFLFCLVWLIFRDLCVELVSLLRKNCPNEFVNWTLDPNEDWCVWTEMILFGMPLHSIVWHGVAWYSIEIERKATLGKLQTTKREKLKPV